MRYTGEAMTKLLQEAWEQVSKLPEDEQDRIARELLEEIQSEAKWEQLFSKSGDLVDRMADEALREDDAGRTSALRFPRRET